MVNLVPSCVVLWLGVDGLKKGFVRSLPLSTLAGGWVDGMTDEGGFWARHSTIAWRYN